MTESVERIIVKAISRKLKERFTNMSVNETMDLAFQIFDVVVEEAELVRKNKT